MESVDGLSDEDCLEAQLLTDPVAQPEYEESIGGGKVLYRATFEELEEDFLNYETIQWILISLLLILAWGVGILLLLYTPVRRYVMRQDFRSRKLYVTYDAIIYKVTRPVFLPWLGVSKIETCILLPLITDIVVEQGCLQSLFGVHSVRIETLGKGRPFGDYSTHICGLANPRQFRKVVLTAATTLREDGSSSMSNPKNEGSVMVGIPRLSSKNDSLSPPSALPQAVPDSPWQRFSPYIASAPDTYFSTSGETLLRKLDDLRNSVNRIEMLISSRQSQLLESHPNLSGNSKQV